MKEGIASPSCLRLARGAAARRRHSHAATVARRRGCSHRHRAPATGHLIVQPLSSAAPRSPIRIMMPAQAVKRKRSQQADAIANCKSRKTTTVAGSDLPLSTERCSSVPYTRQHLSERVAVDDATTWVVRMEIQCQAGFCSFNATKRVLQARHQAVCLVYPKQLASAYKLGDPFPSHFMFAGSAYTLDPPVWLLRATRLERKNEGFMLRSLEEMIRLAQWDALTALVIGLCTAGKLPTHWAELKEC